MRLMVLAGLAAMIVGGAEAADRDAQVPPFRQFVAARMLAVTLDKGAGARFRRWLESYASAHNYPLSLHSVPGWGPDYLVWTLSMPNVEIGGDNLFDPHRFAVKFYRYQGRTEPDEKALKALAEDFAQSVAKGPEGVTVSPSVAVWQSPSGKYVPLYDLDITLDPGARSRFVNRLRGFARKYGYVTLGGGEPYPHSPEVFFRMLGKTAFIAGGNPFDPLKYSISFYRNGPPESSTDEEVGRIADEFAGFVGEVKGVTVSGTAKRGP